MATTTTPTTAARFALLNPRQWESEARARAKRIKDAADRGEDMSDSACEQYQLADEEANRYAMMADYIEMTDAAISKARDEVRTAKDEILEALRHAGEEEG